MSVTGRTSLALQACLPHPDVLGVLALGDPHHPQELVDVVARVADHAPEDDEHVVHVQRPHDLIGCALVGRHRLAHLGGGRKQEEKIRN